VRSLAPSSPKGGVRFRTLTRERQRQPLELSLQRSVWLGASHVPQRVPE
jgi:hypothetical protein